MGGYIFLRIVIEQTLYSWFGPPELISNLEPDSLPRKLRNLLLRLIELLDVFGVITFCVGNLMVIKAQNCYSDAPLSAFLSLSLVIITDICLLLPFIRKIFLLCSQGMLCAYDMQYCIPEIIFICFF